MTPRPPATEPPPPEPRPDRGRRGGLFLRGIDPARMDTDGGVVLLGAGGQPGLPCGDLRGRQPPPLGRHRPGADDAGPGNRPHPACRGAGRRRRPGSNGPPIIEANPDIKPPSRPRRRGQCGRPSPTASRHRPRSPPQPSPLAGDAGDRQPSVIQAGPNDPGRAPGGLPRAPASSAAPATPPPRLGQAAGRGGDAGPRVSLPPGHAPAAHASTTAWNWTTPAPPRRQPQPGRQRRRLLVPGPGHGKSVDGTGSRAARALARDALASTRAPCPGVALGPPPLEPPFQPPDARHQASRRHPPAPSSPPRWPASISSPPPPSPPASSNPPSTSTRTLNTS